MLNILDDCHQIFLQNGNTARFSLYTESGNILKKKEKKKIFSPFIKKRILLFSLHSKTRQDKFESILELIESVVSSPFVKAEADLVEYFVLCLKRSVRLH
jgi:hypothetical protein